MTPQSEQRRSDWPKGLYLRDTTYRFKRMVQGKQYLIPLGDDFRAAEADRINKQIALDIDPVKGRKQDKTTVGTFLPEYLRLKHGLREKSLQRYQAILDNFSYWCVQHFGHDPRLTEITYEVAREYITARKRGPVISNEERRKRNKYNRSRGLTSSKWTIRMERDTLNSVRRELIPKNPFDDVKVDRPTQDDKRAVRHPLTPAEQDLILEAARSIETGAGNPDFADVLLFLFKTGLRDDELRKLEWSDVDFREKVIRIRKKTVTETRRCTLGKKAVTTLAKYSKGKSATDKLFGPKDLDKLSPSMLPIRSKKELRVGDLDLAACQLTFTDTYEWDPKATNGVVPLGETAMTILNRLKATARSNFVFAHYDGGACRLKLLDLLKKAQAKAGIPGRLRLHDTRHSRGAYLRSQGVSLEVIMGMLRHANIEETLAYAPYNLQEGRKAVEQYD